MQDEKGMNIGAPGYPGGGKGWGKGSGGGSEDITIGLIDYGQCKR
jgi:hypothetical protein